MNSSISQNIQVISKYIGTMVLVVSNVSLGLVSGSLGLFVGYIVLNITFPSMVN